MINNWHCLGIEIDAANQVLWSSLRSCQEAYEADRKSRFAIAATDRQKEEEKNKRIDLAKAAAAVEKAEREKEKKNENVEAELSGFFSEIADTSSASSSSQTGAESKVDSEEDLLSGFFSDVQDAPPAVVKAVKDETFMHEKYTNEDLGDRKLQYDRIMKENYEWRNLNPYFVLQLGIDATEEDIKQRWVL